MHIKICGLTNLADTLAAAEAGADYLGFNFYARSPRCITPDTCAKLRNELARRGLAAKTVGIFVNHAPAEVAALLDYCGLDLAQLHGDEHPEQLGMLWGRAFKAVRDPRGADWEALSVFSPGQPAFLLDANTPDAYGGTGQTADWDAARAVAARYPIFLAGGLNPRNVAAAVEHVRPWGVDVASGVEAEPGRKDHAKIRAFVAAARTVRAHFDHQDTRTRS
jgi:phosphoribosylanthranilate isomerase